MSYENSMNSVKVQNGQYRAKPEREGVEIRERVMDNMRLKTYSPQMMAKKVLLGTMFGDGCLVSSQYGTGNAYFVMNHSIDQTGYVLWLMQMLEPITGGFSVRMFKRNGNQEWSKRPKVNAWSLSNKYLGHIFDDFYKFDEENNRFIKVVRLNVLRRLTPESLAVWYMDDGCLSKTKSTIYIRLCTNGFSGEENELIAEYMSETWDIHFRLTRHNAGLVSWYLYTDTNSTKRFIELVKPYICPDMLYKIDPSQSVEHLDEFQGDDMIRTVLGNTELIRKYQPLIVMEQ